VERVGASKLTAQKDAVQKALAALQVEMAKPTPDQSKVTALSTELSSLNQALNQLTTGFAAAESEVKAKLTLFKP
jgi:hypothetical protein